MPIPGYLCGSISIHAPRMGSDKHFLHACAVVAHISIHAPRMGSDLRFNHLRMTQIYFNPRSRMGSDVMKRFVLADGAISIHAPAWGATKPSLGHAYCGIISIHAPAWGATQVIMKTCNELKISIHAPAWGATLSALLTMCAVLFQSTLPHGERQFAILARTIMTAFQSTLPHGERLTEIRSTRDRDHFNPRSRMGSDPPYPLGA